MKLSEYLDREGVNREKFAAICRVTTEAVRLWEKGHRIPRAKAMQRIAKASRGAVKPSDFYAIG